MIVSVKVSLALATQAKQNALAALLRRLRAYTQQYIDSLWVERGKLDAATLNRFDFPQLSYRQRQTCLKVALETIIATKKSARALDIEAGKPTAPKRMRLSSLVCNIEEGRGSFDFVFKISGLVKGQRIVIPFKSHAVLNKWLAVPGAKLLQGATVNETEACLWIEIPDQELKTAGDILAVDAGLCKLLVDSEGKHYGADCCDVLNKVRRRQPGSKGKQRALSERKHYLNRIIKQIPFERLQVIGHEDLTNIKKGKKPNRSKNFRKLLAPWVIRQVFVRLAFVARLNRVRVVRYDPRDTSRTCPACRTVDRKSRKGELFECTNCGHRQDADEVGAHNGLIKTLAILEEPIVPPAETPALAIAG